MTDLKDIEPVAAITEGAQSWLYTAAQVTELLAEREARIQELEEALKFANTKIVELLGYSHVKITQALSTTSPKSALDAVVKKAKVEAFEKVMDAWSDAVQCDLENGVKWLNEKASSEFACKYPEISHFGETIRHEKDELEKS